MAAPVHAIATADKELRDAIIAEVIHELRSYVTSDGRLALPIQSNIASTSA